MTESFDPTALPVEALLQGWPVAAFLLDRDATVIAQGGGEASLRPWLPADARGSDFFLDVIPGGEVPELGGAFHAAMDDDDLLLDIDVSWRLGIDDRSVDVRLRLRKVEVAGATLCIATVEDDTRLRTAERALAAAMGEAREPGMNDPVTGFFTRRQLEFVLPIELRRGHRYGFSTSLIAIDLRRAARPRDPAAVTDQDRAEVAGYLRGVLRQTDVCFYFQTARFHVVLTHADAPGAHRAIERAQAAFHSLHAPADPRAVLTLRFAVVTQGPTEGPVNYVERAHDMVAEVDQELDRQERPRPATAGV